MWPEDYKLDEPAELYYKEGTGDYKPLGKIHKLEAVETTPEEDQAILDSSLLKRFPNQPVLGDKVVIKMKIRPSAREYFQKFMRYGSDDKRRIKRCKRIMRLYRRKYQCNHVRCIEGDVIGFSDKTKEMYFNLY